VPRRCYLESYSSFFGESKPTSRIFPAMHSLHRYRGVVPPFLYARVRCIHLPPQTSRSESSPRRRKKHIEMSRQVGITQKRVVGKHNGHRPRHRTISNSWNKHATFLDVDFWRGGIRNGFLLLGALKGKHHLSRQLQAPTCPFESPHHHRHRLHCWLWCLCRFLHWDSGINPNSCGEPSVVHRVHGVVHDRFMRCGLPDRTRKKDK
jgi:hypothetical protein